MQAEWCSNLDNSWTKSFGQAADKLLKILEREMGLEPTTSSLGSWHSTTELLPLGVQNEPLVFKLLKIS